MIQNSLITNLLSSANAALNADENQCVNSADGADGSDNFYNLLIGQISNLDADEAISVADALVDDNERELSDEAILILSLLGAAPDKPLLEPISEPCVEMANACTLWQAQSEPAPNEHLAEVDTTTLNTTEATPILTDLQQTTATGENMAVTAEPMAVATAITANTQTTPSSMTIMSPSASVKPQSGTLQSDLKSNSKTSSKTITDSLVHNQKGIYSIDQLFDETLMSKAKLEVMQQQDIQTHADAPLTLPVVSSTTTKPQQAALLPTDQMPSEMLEAHIEDVDWSDKMGERLIWLANKNIQNAKIHVNPPELGPIEVRISLHKDLANIQFSAQHTAIRDILENSLSRLREMFEDVGVDLRQVDVSDQQLGQGSTQHHSHAQYQDQQRQQRSLPFTHHVRQASESKSQPNPHITTQQSFHVTRRPNAQIDAYV